MLKGLDISHHNEHLYRQGKLNLDKQDFIMMKATEGVRYVDPMMQEYMNDVIKYNKLYGFYHYARPELNSPIDEAKHFCEAIGTDGLGAMLALDWEGHSLTQPIEWAVEWLNYVYNHMGHRPLFYTSSWYTKKTAKILENNNGLWIAHYTKANKPKVYTYPTYTMWQYTSEPYDKDIFNGDTNTWLKFL